CICDDWAGAHESDQVGLALAANHCYHRVPSRDEGWHQVLADRSCGSGEEDPRVWLTSAVCHGRSPHSAGRKSALRRTETSVVNRDASPPFEELCECKAPFFGSRG